jgi:hypothetical protein
MNELSSLINCEKSLDLLGAYATANVYKRIVIRFYCGKELISAVEVNMQKLNSINN